MSYITFGHYAQDENDFEGYILSSGEWTEATLTITQDEDWPEGFVLNQPMDRAEAHPVGLFGEWDSDRRPMPPVDKVHTRGGIVVEWYEVDSYRCAYGSQDKLYYVITKVDDPQMGESASKIFMEGYVPVHKTNRGRVSFGIGCGCGPDSITETFSEEARLAHEARFAPVCQISWKESRDQEENFWALERPEIPPYWGREAEEGMPLCKALYDALIRGIIESSL